jgi:type I restriction enzyme R subunit
MQFIALQQGQFMSAATPENSEWLARKKLIDPQLTAWGWKIVSWPKVHQQPMAELSGCAIEEFPTVAGPADYALCVDGLILGIVEAKKLTLGPQGVLPQAERYAKGVTDSPFNFRGYRVPFLYATNGEVVWFHDVREQLAMSRRIARFHTPDALRESLGRNFSKSCEWFTSTPNDQPKLRPYQKAANAATEQAIADQKRQMLIAMATGTLKQNLSC